jgi:serine/threonine-protein kinase
VQVLDWGCARIVACAIAAEDARNATGRLLLRAVDSPQADEIAGTLGFMAPEQMNGRAIDARADVFALGAILFEVLTLTPLRTGKTPAELVKQILEGTESRPSLRCPDASVPHVLDDLVERALALTPEDRPASARELAQAVEAHLDDEAQRARVRDSAAEHALAALRAANDARTDATHSARADALREAARALALDPDNETANAVLSGMLVRPPTVPPPAAHRVLDVAERTPAADGIRAFGWRAALWAAIIPLGLSLGVRDWRGAALPVAAIALFAGTVLFARLRNMTSRASKLAILATASLAVATFAGLFGPFVIVPALSATVATAFAMFHGSRDRALAIALGVGAIIGPLGLEAGGVVAESMHVTREGIVLLPRAVWFSPAVTCALLLIANVLAIPVNVIIAGRLRDAADAATRKLALHAWQLEHTLPAKFRTKRENA